MINGDILLDAIISAANHLSNNKKQTDDLNIFPVPDGDTGTNMSMTLSNAVRELEKISGATAGKVASVNASALLRGARGNSGVITSLLFRGFAKGIGEEEYLTAENLARALTLGVEAAYKAVMKPTEGTILTVARVASEYAKQANIDGKDELAVFEAAIDGAEKALAETRPNLEIAEAGEERQNKKGKRKPAKKKPEPKKEEAKEEAKTEVVEAQETKSESEGE